MAKDPAFLFYPGDWMGGTSLMPRFIKGCYMDILIAQFNNGPLTLEEIKTVLGSDFGTAWPAIQKKFEITDDHKFFNVRLKTEMEKRKNYSKSRSENRKGNISKTYDNHMSGHMENRNRNENRTTGKGSLREKPEQQFFDSEAEKSTELLNSQVWLENICIKLKLSLDEGNRQLNFFILKESLKSDYLHKSLKDTKDHFVNWLEIKRKDALEKNGPARGPKKAGD